MHYRHTTSFIGPLCLSVFANAALLTGVAHWSGTDSWFESHTTNEMRIRLRLVEHKAQRVKPPAPSPARLPSLMPVANAAQLPTHAAARQRLTSSPIAWRMPETATPVAASQVMPRASTAPDAPAADLVSASSAQSIDGVAETADSAGGSGNTSPGTSNAASGRREESIAASAATEPAPARSMPAPTSTNAAGSPPKGVTRGARILRESQPPYPPSARRDGVEGTVCVRVSLDESGGVERVVVSASSGDRRLDDAARSEVANWKFTARVEYGVPTPSTLNVRVVFTLNDDR